MWNPLTKTSHLQFLMETIFATVVKSNSPVSASFASWRERVTSKWQILESWQILSWKKNCEKNISSQKTILYKVYICGCNLQGKCNLQAYGCLLKDDNLCVYWPVDVMWQAKCCRCDVAGIRPPRGERQRETTDGNQRDFIHPRFLSRGAAVKYYWLRDIFSHICATVKLMASTTDRFLISRLPIEAAASEFQENAQKKGHIVRKILEQFSKY